MTQYHTFIGIDIGKSDFYVAVNTQKETPEYQNTAVGIKKFINDFKEILPNALSVLETTGGYEMKLLTELCKKDFHVHRANTRHVKNFIRSYGNTAKTDKLDAQALAKYGCERHKTLALFKVREKKLINLVALVQRRHDLKQMLVAEKNRFKSPTTEEIKASCKLMIDVLTKEMELITARIKEQVKRDPALQARREILETIPGIGPIIAMELTLLLPELGHIHRRKIASLVGVAPRANDSGQYRGYRRTGHGRTG